MTEALQFTAERARDRAEISQRLYQFFRGVDRKDYQLARGAFHPDAYDDHGPYKGGVDGLLAWIEARHVDIAFSYHHLGNVFIEFAGPDEAMCESYGMTWQSVSPKSSPFATGGEVAPSQMVAAGRYIDHFTRVDERWRILTRTLVLGASLNVPAGASFGPEWTRETRDEHDPSERLRRKLGLTTR